MQSAIGPIEMSALLAAELAKQFPLLAWELAPVTVTGNQGYLRVWATLTIRQGNVLKSQRREVIWPYYYFATEVLALYPLVRQSEILGRGLTYDFSLWMLGADVTNVFEVNPPPPPPPAITLDEKIRAKAWTRLWPAVTPYNPTSAFLREARARKLGLPTTDEFDVDDQRGQGFIGKILACKIDDWVNMRVVEWLG